MNWLIVQSHLFPKSSNYFRIYFHLVASDITFLKEMRVISHNSDVVESSVKFKQQYEICYTQSHKWRHI